MKRRNFLELAGAGIVGSTLLPESVVGLTKSNQAIKWVKSSGSKLFSQVICNGNQFVRLTAASALDACCTITDDTKGKSVLNLKPGQESAEQFQLKASLQHQLHKSAPERGEDLLEATLIIRNTGSSTKNGEMEDMKATPDQQVAWKALFSKTIPGGPTASGFDSYFGTDVPNWPPFCFIENDKTIGIPTEFLPAKNYSGNLASLNGPAAIEQLRLVGAAIPVSVYTDETTKDPVKIARDAIKEAKLKGHDVVIIDTAGRLAIDEVMMKEIESIKNAVNPGEILFVVDSMTGQDAVNTAKEFNDRLNFDGVVLTKLDGDTRGGAALSIRSVVTKPIKDRWFQAQENCQRFGYLRTRSKPFIETVRRYA